jgi:hypothetical protein
MNKYEAFDYSIQSNIIKDQVRKLIPDFQQFCLGSDYDLIIPIENEGLSLLLPALQKCNDIPKIVPSSAVKGFDIDKKIHKKILIEDASTYSGVTLLETKNWFIEKYPTTQVDIGSLIVYDKLDAKIEFAYKNYLKLSQNQYDWARESLSNYLISNVFMHYADPPLWQFNFNESQRIRLYETLIDNSTFYSLPNYCDDCLWHSFSLDNIEVTNSDWMPSFIEVEEFVKIRVFFHKYESKVLILPLFFPVLPSEVLIGLTEILEQASKQFPPELDSVLLYSKEVETEPLLYFRWISTIGSMLLLSKFVQWIKHFGIDLAYSDPFMLGPIPNLFSYSCRKEVLQTFETVMKVMLNNRNYQNDQLHFITDNFVFHNIDHVVWYKGEESIETKILIPEKYLAIVLGKKMNNEYKNDHERAKNAIEIINEGGISYPEIKKISGKLSIFGINRALDVLVDEGTLNPCVIKDDKGMIRRGYYIGGESKRSILRTLGYAYEDIEL